MKGRVNSILWWAVGINAFILCTVLGLAYGAGARSSGIRLRDFTILPMWAGLELMAAAFLVVLASVTLFIVFENKIHKRVADLVDFAERFDAVDPEAHANVTPDDFGLIADTFNRATEKLARIAQVEASRQALEAEIGDVENALVQVGRGELGARLHTEVPSLSPVADGFNVAVENLARRLDRIRTSAAEALAAANQSQSATTTSAAAAARADEEMGAAVTAVDQLAVIGRQINDNGDNAADAARRARDHAEQGNRSVRDAADGMQRIRASMQETAEKIKSLGDRSLEIYEIINIIHETNLLALNAVLEASRGGGSAQPLDLLASELRKLADHSRGATRDIVTLLKAIQAESNDAVVVMEQANRTAENGSRLTDQASKAFVGISALLRQTADLAVTISSASRQHTSDIEAAKTAVSVQAQAAHRNAARTNDALTHAEHVTRICEQLNHALAQFRSGPAVVKPDLQVEVKTDIATTAAAGD